MSGAASWPPVLSNRTFTARVPFFRAPVQVIRRAPGQWQSGEWTPGQPLPPFTILARCQPASVADYSTFQALPEGDRVGQMIRVFTDVRLYVADPENNGPDMTGQPADVILWDSEDAGSTAPASWQIIRRITRNAGLLSHFKYLAWKVVSE